MPGKTLHCHKQDKVDMKFEFHAREQTQLKTKLVTEDCINWGVSADKPFSTLNLIGGVDISFPKGDADHACACLVVLNFPDLEVRVLVTRQLCEL